MLNITITLIVVVVTLAVLLMNLGITKCFAGSPPRGDQAMGLVVPFFGLAAAVLLMTFAAFLACFRVSSTGLSTIHTSTGLSGLITVAIVFGATLAASIAFMLWCEPQSMSASLRGVLIPIELLLGVVGPITLAAWLLIAVWNTKDAVAGNAMIATSLKALFWCVVVLAVSGYGLSGAFLWKTTSRQVTAIASGFKDDAKHFVASGGGIFNFVENEIALEIEKASPDTPLSNFVAVLADQPKHPKLNDKARMLIIERALKVPNFDQGLRECMSGREYIYRQGAAELLRDVPQEQFDQHRDAWGEALVLGVNQTASGVQCRPGFLTEHFDLNPDPMAHVASLLAASKRFEGWTGYSRLQTEFQTMADESWHLKDDKHLPKFLKMLADAGYKPTK